MPFYETYVTVKILYSHDYPVEDKMVPLITRCQLVQRVLVTESKQLVYTLIYFHLFTRLLNAKIKE